MMQGSEFSGASDVDLFTGNKSENLCALQDILNNWNDDWN
jgi:hypothetical protein